MILINAVCSMTPNNGTWTDVMISLTEIVVLAPVDLYHRAPAIEFHGLDSHVPTLPFRYADWAESLIGSSKW